MALAIAGLYLMLNRQTGDLNTFLLWMALITVAVIGLVATRRTLTALGGTGLGLVSSLYLKATQVVAATAAVSEGPPWLNASLGLYFILSLLLAIIFWTRRPRPSSSS